MSELEDKVSTYKRVYAEVDLDAILFNVQNMKANISEQTRMIGVIKTDGYGHGCVPIARCIEPLDYIFGFAVATPEEAHLLRQAGIEKPILILGYAFPYAYEQIARDEVRPAVFREDSIEALSKAAIKVGKTIKVHIKVDTGMSRIGITPDEEGLLFIEKLMKKEGIEIEGIFTHFAKADERDKTDAEKQLQVFKEFICRIEETLGLRIPIKHCSNSAAIIEMPQANMDMVRAGISLYGLYPSEEVNKERVALKPSLSLYSHITYIKTLKKGTAVSYGGTYTAKEDMRVATIPVGYGDGYPRALSGKGYVLIRGKKARILGRVCMDQFMVDVSEIPEALEGDKVTLLGFDGKEHISAELLGDLSGRFNYELVCDLGKRIPRVFVQGGRIVMVSDCF